MILRRLTENLRGQNWTAIAIEFLIVVTGVFIGTQVSNWNQVRLEKQATTRMLEQLQPELRSQLEFFDGVAIYFATSRRYADEAFAGWRNDPKVSDERFVISFEIDGRPMAPKDHPSADFFTAGVDYFKTMGIPIVKGRDFDDRDKHGSTPVVIVTEKFVRDFFPNEEAVGKRIRPGIGTFEDEDTPWREIIGVVGDVRNRGLDTPPPPAYYVPQTQVPFSQLVGVIKTSNDPHSLISAVTKEVAAMDQDVPLFAVKTMDEYMSTSVAGPRFSTTLLSIFAAVALVLTVVGLYGVMSYSVAQRTNEIGIRLALGAQARDVLLMIVKQGGMLIVLGLVIGLAGAYVVTRLITSWLFEVKAKDPFTFAAVAVLLAIVGLLACYIPALRATKVDPMDALRCE